MRALSLRSLLAAVTAALVFALTAAATPPILLPPEDAPAAPQAEEPELTRDERYDALFAELAAAGTDEEAAFVAEEIEALWRDSGSATVDLLTDRATDALDMGDTALARRLIDGALELDPEHAEAWSQSAMIAMADADMRTALEHIERAVSLEPRHYGARLGLGLILEHLGRDAGAYAAYESVLEVNPHLAAAREGAERTARAGHGRDL